MEIDFMSFFAGMFYWVLFDGISSLFALAYEKARFIRAERKQIEKPKK